MTFKLREEKPPSPPLSISSPLHFLEGKKKSNLPTDRGNLTFKGFGLTDTTSTSGM
jgi:hypothetical protein